MTRFINSLTLYSNSPVKCFLCGKVTIINFSTEFISNTLSIYSEMVLIKYFDSSFVKPFKRYFSISVQPHTAGCWVLLNLVIAIFTIFTKFKLWLDKILGHKFEKRKKNQKRENYVIKVLNDYKKEIQTIHNLRNRVFHFEKIYGHKMYNHSNMKDLLDKYIRKLYSTDELMDIVLKCDQP